MIRCSECSHENMDGLEYCDACGAKLSVAPATAAVETVVPAAPAPDEEPTAPTEATPAEGEPVAIVLSDAEGEQAQEEPVAEEQVVVDAPVTPPTESPQPPPTAVVGTAFLTIVRGGTVGKSFPLQAGDNLVGRWDPDSGAFPEVDLEADDPEARISRKHALIRVREQVTIEDIGSLNGTFVNRAPRLELGSPVALKDGDEVIIGKTFFKISLSG
jgi:hypothetical protein